MLSNHEVSIWTTPFTQSPSLTIGCVHIQLGLNMATLYVRLRITTPALLWPLFIISYPGELTHGTTFPQHHLTALGSRL